MCFSSGWYLYPLVFLEDCRYGKAHPFAQYGKLIYCSLFGAGRLVSAKGDVVLFMLSLSMFIFTSSHCSLGCSVGGVDGMEWLLLHPFAKDNLFQD